ncbi:hypothetical protein NAP1_12588 [Erythrobacter sp. NAP1]|uniref:hypothetical protein n=1 Tax=Erythrobacter sp. NAP1 TaxID=237727 RepID=UPI00006875EE|nr:hypothetical protein [Erythrobacter sp. NAP1]EAQ28435.1 hypothetical protein NAP1_12588 [Erythrobacter sp. NAP1]
MMHTRAPERIDLGSGHQAVINGALVTADGPCTLIVNAGAMVIAQIEDAKTDRSSRNPREELYFSLIEKGASPYLAEEDQVRCFTLLSEIASRPISAEDEHDCRSCCTAMMESRLTDALVYAARLASHSVGPDPLRAKPRPAKQAPQRNENDCLYSTKESIGSP